jgi:PEP-CTERM motif
VYGDTRSEQFVYLGGKEMTVMRFFVRCMAVAALGVTSSIAATIDLGINGDAQVGPDFINFGNYPNGTIFTPTPGYGVFIISQPPLGAFLTAGVTAGESGKIQSISAAATPPGVVLTPNTSSDFPFMTFDTGGSNLKLFLTELVPGETVGPFSLVNSQNGAIASFNIDGFIFNTTTNGHEDVTGTFSATFNGTTVAELLAADQAGQLIQTPFSGTFSLQTIPEPSTLLLFGGAMLCAGAISRFKIRK